MKRRVRVNINKLNRETGKYEFDFFAIGVFHEFGCDYQQFDLGAGTYSTAIVEMSDGKVINVPVEHIEFVDPITDDELTDVNNLKEEALK